VGQVNYEYRQVGSTWFLEELPTREDLEALAAGGRADVMVTHDSPAPGTEAVNRIRATPGGWRDDALKYAAHGTEIITEAWTSVDPDLLIHGHFHTQGEVTLRSGQRIVSLAAETHPGNVVLLDLTTMTTTWLEDIE
jgi:Icc-related predicted phosphoesterase